MVLAVAVLAVAAAALAAWKGSDRVLVPDHSNGPFGVDVKAVGPDAISLERTESTRRRGLYSLNWESGHAVVGRILSSAPETVRRRLRRLHGTLDAETDVNLRSAVYDGNPRATIGLPFSDVRIPGELGPMPAWQVSGGTSAWAIAVHGINADRADGMRLVPSLRRAGLTTLLISYRGDEDAPASPDGFHHMGLTEWRDLEAAVRYAQRRGAKRLLLIGYSMGGAIVTQFLEQSRLAHLVAGALLDAPVLDWREALAFGAEQMGLPRFFATPVEWAVGARIDADWGRLDALRHTEELRLPTLLFHGTEDDIVPIETSDAFADALPHLVSYFRVPNAGHTGSWNVDPALYEARLRRFLVRTGLVGGHERRRADERRRAAQRAAR